MVLFSGGNMFKTSTITSWSGFKKHSVHGTISKLPNYFKHRKLSEQEKLKLKASRCDKARKQKFDSKL